MLRVFTEITTQNALPTHFKNWNHRSTGFPSQRNLTDGDDQRRFDVLYNVRPNVI